MFHLSKIILYLSSSPWGLSHLFLGHTCWRKIGSSIKYVTVKLAILTPLPVVTLSSWCPPPHPPSEKLKQNIFHLFYRTQIDLQNYLTILNVFKNWGISWNAPFSISIGHWLRFAFYQSNICQVHKLSTINCTILLKIKVFTRELSFGDFNISIGLAGLGSQLTDFLTPTP